jgi:OOP family OmpA-OmpF porin
MKRSFFKWMYVFAMMLFIGGVNAQVTTSTSGFSDELTVDPAQNSQWKQGQAKFSAKPRDMWELGLHAGSFILASDVPPQIPGGFAFGFHVRKSLNYTFSLRFDADYGSYKGFDYQFVSSGQLGLDYPAIADQYGNARSARVFHAKVITASFQGIFNMGNILFHRDENKWNLYFLGGLGLYMHDTNMDFLDAEGQPYDFSGINLNPIDADERKQTRNAIKDLLDGDYETKGRSRNDDVKVGDAWVLKPVISLGGGLTRKINRRVNVGLEYQIRVSSNDLLDGFRFRTVNDLTNNNDLMHYASLRVGINLGSFASKTEPLYWVNPLDAVYNDIADLKKRPVLDLTDTDADGIIDMLDAEPASPTGAIVDVKGKTVDSDGDEIPDYLDKEPFSPPGFGYNEEGVANVPEYMTEEKVLEIVNDKVSNIKVDWFLPSIYFDFDEYIVKPQSYASLQQIAQVMQAHPDVKVVAQGHADVRGKSDYNNVLSYNRSNAAVDYLVARYGIPKDRFIMQYSGDEENLVPDLPETKKANRETEAQQALNRRVEFRIATPEDTAEEKPTGPEAGKGAPNPPRTGTKYSGSRNTGY